MPLERSSHRISPRNFGEILIHLRLPNVELLGFIENISDDGVGAMVPVDENETIRLNAEDVIVGVIGRKHDANEHEFTGRVARSSRIQIGNDYFQGIGIEIDGGVDDALLDLVLK